MDILKELSTVGAKLAERDRLLARRDELIVEARRAGHPWRQIADAAGVSFQTTQAAGKRANGGIMPMPREGTLRDGARAGR